MMSYDMTDVPDYPDVADALKERINKRIKQALWLLQGEIHTHAYYLVKASKRGRQSMQKKDAK